MFFIDFMYYIVVSVLDVFVAVIDAFVVSVAYDVLASNWWSFARKICSSNWNMFARMGDSKKGIEI